MKRLMLIVVLVAGCGPTATKSTEYKHSLKSEDPEVRLKGIGERVNRYGVKGTER